MDDTLLVSTDLILNTLKKWVEEKIPISPHLWVDASLKLTLFLGDENSRLFELQQEVGKLKVGFIQEGKSVAEAKCLVEASDLFKDFCIQKGKIESIKETIRVAKLQARLSTDEYKLQ